MSGGGGIVKVIRTVFNPVDAVLDATVGTSPSKIATEVATDKLGKEAGILAGGLTQPDVMEDVIREKEETKAKVAIADQAIAAQSEENKLKESGFQEIPKTAELAKKRVKDEGSKALLDAQRAALGARRRQLLFSTSQSRSLLG
jgi:hypothetical protein